MIPARNGAERSAHKWAPYIGVAVAAAVLSALGGHVSSVGERSCLGLPGGYTIALLSGLWLACVLGVLLFPRGVGLGQGRWAILLVAAICRGFLLPHPASDDVNRYLWEGRMVREGVNPYVYAPDHASLESMAEDDPYHAAVNHPDLSAAYAPLMLLIFAGVGSIAYSPLLLKAAMVACDLATLCLLFVFLERRRLPLRWSLLYALNPVILQAFAAEGHLDAFQVLCLVAALLAYDCRRWPAMFVLLGLAVQCKYVALVCLPFLVQRDNLKWVPLSLLAMLLPVVPFLSDGVAPLFASLREFGADYAFNGPLHRPLLQVFNQSIPLATATCSGVLAGLVVWAWFRLHPARKGCDVLVGTCFVLGGVVILSPTVHVWYLAWLVPFAVLLPSGYAVTLWLTASLYYVTVGRMHQAGVWDLPWLFFVVQWLPIYWMLAKNWKRFVTATAVGATPAQTASVVIPVRNEMPHFVDCLLSVFACNSVSDVIVVDAGSTDGTAEAAREQDVTVIPFDLPPEAGGGRGGQILAGVERAQGDVVFVVHGDTEVRADDIDATMELLQRNPSVIGGALGTTFSGDAKALRFVELTNDSRAFLSGITFGDQVQFFRRRPVIEAGLYPAIPMMEDVELSLRLPRLGRCVYLFGSSPVSARRWERGRVRRARLIVRVMTAYLVGRLFGRTDPHAMYRAYYG